MAAVTGVPGSVTEADRWSALYRAHVPGAQRLAYLLTGDHALGEDIAHDAFVRAIGRFADLRSPESFGGYLRRAVVNGVRSHARSASRERARAERSARLAGPGTAQDAPDEGDELWAALDRLPDRQRAAIVLRYWLDLSDQDVGRALGCRPGTVRSLLSRGLATMREVIGDA